MRVSVAPWSRKLLLLLFLLLFLGSAACGSRSGSGMNSTDASTATTGGAATSGGTNNPTGGAASTGGRVSAGGTTTPAGGAASTGGLVTAGGTVASSGGIGGGSMTGGARTGGSSANAGGTPGSGGSLPGGACVESSCGSHKWACWKVPTPASLGLSNAQNYTDLGNGAVRDNLTCLVWEKANPTTSGSWTTSSNRCAALGTSNFAGYSDWRLPSRVEMASITDLHGSNGFNTIFSGFGAYMGTISWWYEQIQKISTAGFHFGYGTNGFTSNAVAMASGIIGKCVRGNGTGEAANALASPPPGQYTVTGTSPTAIVTDNYTKLSWQQTFSSSTMAWSAGPGYCTSQTTGGSSDWRVPTLQELATTVNEALVSPAINRTVFPGVPSCGSGTWFWASEASLVGGTAWGINYCDGYTGWNAGASGSWNYFTVGYVRCVRGG